MCWTLVHSLWQGLLLAMVTGLIILFTRRSEAKIRHGLFSAAALIFLIGACFTFGWQWNKDAGFVDAGTSVIGDAHLATSPSVGQDLTGHIATPSYQAIMNRLVDYFNEHAAAVVTIWFVLFSMRLAKILVNLGATQRIRHHRVHTPSAYWIERLQELANLLHIKTRVALVESELIRVPMMAGIFKPVILLPFSLLSQLPPEQVEAVLLHELAHIRRGDYMFNLVQSFAEILFFFNPGVLWISSLIREERENCCDDIAVSLTGSKKEFIHALVSFQEYNQSVNRFAIAFRGTGNHLLQRVKRILYRDNKVLDGREKFFLLCSCLVTAGLMLAFSSAPRASGMKMLMERAAMRTSVVKRDTLMPMLMRDSLTPVVKRDTLTLMVMRDTVPPVKPVPANPDTPPTSEGPLTPASADTSVIPRIDTEPIKPVKPAIGRKMVPPPKPIDPVYPKKAIKGTGVMGMDEESVQQWKTQLDEWEAKQAEWQAKQIEWQLTQEKWSKHLQELQQQATKDNAESAEGNFREQEAALIEQQRVLGEAERELNAKLIEIAMEERKLDLQQRMLNGEQRPDMRPEKFPTVPPIGWKKSPAFPHAKLNYITPIINDLMAEKLIDNPEVFSFVLNKEGLFVNGVRQSDEIYRRFREKYIKDPRTELKYSRKKDGSESNTVNVFN